MFIDSIRIKFSWESINKAVMSFAEEIPLKDMEISYNEAIIIKGRIKWNIPVSITIDNTSWSTNAVRFHIRDMALFLKLPDMVKDFIVKCFAGDEVLYKKDEGSIIVGKSVLDKILPFKEYKINLINLSREYMEFELIDVNMDETGQNLTIEDVQGVEDNENVEFEDFKEEKIDDYYEKLRDRIDRYARSNLPKKYHNVIPYLFLLPDVLVMLVRLFRDKRIELKDKALIASGITYIISPFDLMPDIVLPFGALDDLGIAFFVLDKLLLSVPDNVLKENFSGSGDVVDFIKKNYSGVRELLPSVKLDKVIEMLNKLIKKSEAE